MLEKLGAKFGAEIVSFTRAAGVPCRTVHADEKPRPVRDDGVPRSTVDEERPMLERDSLGITGLGSGYSGRKPKCWRRGGDTMYTAEMPYVTAGVDGKARWTHGIGRHGAR